MKHMDWEREIIDIIIDKGEMPNGDAQGVVMAHPFELAQGWAKDSTPEQVADKILNLAE